MSIVSPEPLEAIDVPGEIERTFHSLEMTRGIPTAPMYLMSQMAVNGLAERIGYEAQYSSKSITDDPFDAMSHEEIWDKASSLKADTIDVTAHNWRNLGYNAATDAAEFASALSGTIGVDWQGIAADAAGQGVLRYSHSAVELVLASENLAAKVMQSHDAVVNTARLLGPPVPYGIGEKLLDANSWVTRTLSFGLIKSNQHMHEEAEEAARMVMKTHYAPVIRQAAIEVPVLPPAGLLLAEWIQRRRLAGRFRRTLRRTDIRGRGVLPSAIVRRTGGRGAVGDGAEPHGLPGEHLDAGSRMGARNGLARSDRYLTGVGRRPERCRRFGCRQSRRRFGCGGRRFARAIRHWQKRIRIRWRRGWLGERQW